MFSRALSFTLAFSMTLAMMGPQQVASAQGVPYLGLNLPVPGSLIQPTAQFTPVQMKGLTVDLNDPLHFNFIINQGDTRLGSADLRDEATRLIKYFMAALTVPEDEMWVNLSPYEDNRIIPTYFGQTEMGRDLLAQDYMLKQITSSLMYPEEALGQKFWQRVYARARKEFGTSEIPMNTFNKIWIVPETADVYEHNASVFVVNSRLKVMLEEDYFAEVSAQRSEVSVQRSEVSDQEGLTTENRPLITEIIREILIPEIEREINRGETFANLRQIYNAMILATWYKQNLYESLLGQIYVDQNKIKGIDDARPGEDGTAPVDKIYAQYVEAFKTGVYDYIKDEYDPLAQNVIPRKYFSGGFVPEVSEAMRSLPRGAIPLEQRAALLNSDGAMSFDVKLLSENGRNTNFAMSFEKQVEAMVARAAAMTTSPELEPEEEDDDIPLSGITYEGDLLDFYDSDTDQRPNLNNAFSDHEDGIDVIDFFDDEEGYGYSGEDYEDDAMTTEADASPAMAEQEVKTKAYDLKGAPLDDRKLEVTFAPGVEEILDKTYVDQIRESKLPQEVKGLIDKFNADPNNTPLALIAKGALSFYVTPQFPKNWKRLELNKTLSGAISKANNSEESSSTIEKDFHVVQFIPGQNSEVKLLFGSDSVKVRVSLNRFGVWEFIKISEEKRPELKTSPESLEWGEGDSELRFSVTGQGKGRLMIWLKSPGTLAYVVTPLEVSAEETVSEGVKNVVESEDPQEGYRDEAGEMPVENLQNGMSNGENGENPQSPAMSEASEPEEASDFLPEGWVSERPEGFDVVMIEGKPVQTGSKKALMTDGYKSFHLKLLESGDTEGGKRYGVELSLEGQQEERSFYYDGGMFNDSDNRRIFVGIDHQFEGLFSFENGEERTPFRNVHDFLEGVTGIFRSAAFDVKQAADGESSEGAESPAMSEDDHQKSLSDLAAEMEENEAEAREADKNQNNSRPRDEGWKKPAGDPIWGENSPNSSWGKSDTDVGRRGSIKPGIVEDKDFAMALNQVSTLVMLILMPLLPQREEIKIADVPGAEMIDKAGASTGVADPVGGIDLNPALLDLRIKRDASGIPFSIDQQPADIFEIEGFIPIIINVTPVTNLPLLLGFTDEPQQEDNTRLSYQLSRIDPAEYRRKFSTRGKE